MNKDKKVITIFVLLSVIGFAIAIGWIISAYSLLGAFKDLIQIYASIDEESYMVLNEVEGVCPSCGQLAMGMNDEIVCRNEDCAMYGIPVKIN